jgi:hypothetical protein
MSCNDTNNNHNDSTNQVKDPPKIILSDHSTNQNILQGENFIKNFSDNDTVNDKNCLNVPIESFSSEARPP